MILPVLADKEYFRSGQFLSDLKNGKVPILIDPSLSNSQKAAVTELNFGYNLPLRTRDNEPYDSNPTPEELDSNQFDIEDWRSLFPDRFTVGFRTSGSSGEPKIFFKTEKEIFSELIQLRKFYLNQHDLREYSFLVSIPLCHLYGFLWGYMLPYSLKVDCIDSKNLSDTMRNLRDGRLCSWITIPSQIKSILDLESESRILSLKRCQVVSSGSVLQESIARDFQDRFHSTILEIYGSTETGGIGYRYPSHESGYLLFDGVNLRIDNEMCLISSPHILSELQTPEGFYSLNDSLSFHNNRIYYNGRIDRVIKRNSKRIHLDEIEQELESILSIESCLVVEYESEKIGLVIDSHKINLEKTQIQELIYNSIPRYMLPDKILFSSPIPRTYNGKKDYKNARELFFHR